MFRVFLILASVSVVFSADLPDTATDAAVTASTCSLYSSDVLGWMFNASTSNQWTKGQPEGHNVGDTASVGDHHVRAVALGIEGDHVVFFTLRYFVDPLYPNPCIQGISSTILDRKRIPIALGSDDKSRASFIRYGSFQLAWYKDLGGGLSMITKVINGVTEWDTDAPARFDGKWLPQIEVHDGGRYPRPHEKISVDEHFKDRELGSHQQTIVRYIDNHDVAILYVPVTSFGGVAPPSLQLKHPTLDVDLFLRKSRDLYGFRFNLIGQETFDAMTKYTPPSSSAAFPGIDKLLSIGYALDPETFGMLKEVDTCIDQVLPDVGVVHQLTDVFSAWQTVTEPSLGSIAKLLAALRSEHR